MEVDIYRKNILIHKEASEFIGNVITELETSATLPAATISRLREEYDTYPVYADNMYTKFVGGVGNGTNPEFIVRTGLDGMLPIAKKYLVTFSEICADRKIKAELLKLVMPNLLVSTRPTFSNFASMEALEKSTPESLVKFYLGELGGNNSGPPIIRLEEKDGMVVCEMCGSSVHFSKDTGEVDCMECGYTKSLHGMIADSRAGSSSKKKMQNAVIHGMRWLYQLQAKEQWKPSDCVLQPLSAIIKKEFVFMSSRKCYDLQKLTCEYIRVLLKRIGAPPEMNNHVPTIRKLLTGTYGAKQMVPTQLTNPQEQIVINDFSRAIEVYESIKNTEEVLNIFNKTVVTNIKYYPYFIYKIIEYRFPKYQELLSCIHLQKSATLSNNDKLWKVICRHTGFTYKST
jgi:hypothetical protein